MPDKVCATVLGSLKSSGAPVH